MIELETLNKILNKKKFIKYDNSCIHYNEYMNYKDKLKKIKNITIEEGLNIIKTSQYYPFFIQVMNKINKNLIYKSEGHGIKHNERVAIYVFILSVLNKLSKEDFKILLEAAKYHDCGRTNDEEDSIHGYRSSLIIDKNINDLNKDDKEILKVICITHALADKSFKKVVKKYKIKNISRCKKLFEILKDSDALDRVRLDYDNLDIKYLRNKYSKSLVLMSYDLYNNY